ncbi:MAG: DNRLRE domain-containing protein, partial [Eubacterium sp.]|nr:DNRLRE domain-containing protein [Eubacterium sp.]
RDEHYTECTYTLEQLDDYTYIMSVTVDKSWLVSEATVYPVTIDPTTSNLSNYKDAGIYSSATSRVIPYGNEATCCFGRTSNSEFGYGRVLNYFSWPEEIKKGAKINSAYIWERETTGRTSTTYVAPCLVKDHWVESSVTWENRPDYYPATTMASKNINSKSTDKSGDPYWYKFDITSAVQYWTDGIYHNYGLLFRSSEEDDGNYNWRAFASKQHSTSSYRPYTVINYTNDTTAPTINSVTGNPTSWTNGNVTLTINGAADNSGGSGLHSTPYSFSTTQGSYAWQSGNTKTFSSNCTVYIYVRDALGNIRLASTQTINKIDKIAPSVPTVTGNATAWTNGSVTLSANSADSQSGIAAYSFSTVEGSYSWQTGKTKTVAENTTLYIYSKDNAGNISQPVIVAVDKIDKTAPEIPLVTGNTESWTNNNIVLTAQSDDDLSGICEYSFSNEPDKYNWQSKNTFEADKLSKVYVCAKDNAGNISGFCELDLRIDKLSPTGSISAQNPTDWVRNVTITADASDEISGLHEMPYSFSSSEDSYNWQAEGKTVITSNGTYYIYARDAAENITLLDTFTVDKIDSASPVISDIKIEDEDNRTVITVTASDSQSGISQYSIDKGQTWQDSNVFEIEKDSQNYIDIKVKDNVGNIASRHYDFYTPQMYIENDKLCLYSPNLGAADNTIYYSFRNIGSSVKYENPMDLADCGSRIYLNFYKTFSRSNSLTIDYKSPNRFSYSESNVDLSLSYNSVRFDIARKYADGEWSYSFDNFLETNDNGALIRVRMPDLNTYYFVKQSKYLYVSQNYDYELSVVYDDNDSNIVEYIVKCNDVFYHYSPDGLLVEISNKYGTAFSFTHTNEYIKIQDGAGRITLLSFENEWFKVIDAGGAVISYLFDDEKLLRVTDQAGVIIAEYAYTDNKISKSMDKSIFYDSDGRVAQYLYDNGYSIAFEYGDDSVTTTGSDEKTSKVTYDKYYNILSSTDDYGEVTTYTYDNRNLTKVEKAGEVIAEYSYNSDGCLTYKKESEKSYSYSYDDKNRLIRSCIDNEYTVYNYDDDDNVICTYKYT